MPRRTIRVLLPAGREISSDEKTVASTIFISHMANVIPMQSRLPPGKLSMVADTAGGYHEVSEMQQNRNPLSKESLLQIR